MEIIKLSQKALNKAAGALKSGTIVIFPTDTVYGFLADAANKKAVEKIYKIKKRPRQKPLPVFVKDLKMAKELAETSKEQEKIIKKHWPGKYTFILNYRHNKNQNPIRFFATWQKTVALRMPDYKPLNSLLRKINRPLAQTSVNISGQPELNKTEDIIKKFGTSDVPMLFIDAGDLPKRKPSKIIDITGEALIKLR